MLYSSVSDLRRVTFSILSNVIHTVIYPFKANNYQSLSHGMGRYPDLVVVQLKLTNGYVSEAGGTKCYIQLLDFLSKKNMTPYLQSIWTHYFTDAL